MVETRIIPTLLLSKGNLVKTVKFTDPAYIGDPINTVRIFNELEVDELAFLDIDATAEGREPPFDLLHQIADECFMPLAYGGGITKVDQIRQILSIGFEKVVLNSAVHRNSTLIEDAARIFGSQAIIGSVDAKKNLFGKYEVWIDGGRTNTKKDPVETAKEMEGRGVGELLLNCINREGTWKGLDVDLVRRVTDVVDIPLIATGGAGNLEHIGEAVHQGNASAVGLGSMVVFQKKGMGVLVNFPDRTKLAKVLVDEGSP